MERRRAEDQRDEWKRIRRGWYLGEKQFRKELLEQAHAQATDQHYGEEVGESAEEKANELIARELKRLGWSSGELELRPKGDARKARLARRLRGETTMSKRWIAERLKMGSVSNVTYCLQQLERG